MAKKKYELICQICGKPYKSSYSWSKACPKHRQEWALEHNRRKWREVYCKRYKRIVIQPQNGS